MQFKMVLTTCPFCGTGCNFYLQVMNGKVTGVVPCKTHPISEGQLCVLGRNSYSFVQHEDRLTKPLVRQGDSFVETSWPEACLKIAQQFNRIKREEGPGAFGVCSCAKGTNEENYLVMKFAREVLGTNNIDHCARL
jgi:predicted molibdopterin-dependent oxidoreductase YjgC